MKEIYKILKDKNIQKMYIENTSKCGLLGVIVKNAANGYDEMKKEQMLMEWYYDE